MRYFCFNGLSPTKRETVETKIARMDLISKALKRQIRDIRYGFKPYSSLSMERKKYLQLNFKCM